MSRHKDFTSSLDGIWTWEHGVKIAALWDIRDELKRLNRLLHCANFVRIPQILDRIDKNTTNPKRRKATK